MNKVRTAGWKRLMKLAPEANRIPTEDDMRRIFAIVDNDNNGTISRRVSRSMDNMNRVCSIVENDNKGSMSIGEFAP
jgi:Ca2+-binding EF-hand superfamily protein